MRKFIKGLELCERFFHEVAKPVLDNHFPDLVYTAGLLGYGSDVLGFDDEVSTDHMWGPRFYLFLKEEDVHLKSKIMEAFSTTFPYEFMGYTVNFSSPNPKDHGVRVPEAISEGPVSPLVFLYTPEEYFEEYLGLRSFDDITETDWLAFSEHRLLAITSGKLFMDGLHLEETLQKLCFYPEKVRLFLIASNWSLIAEEQAFVRRCADVGDEIGSRLSCGRICERLMRLAFLYCRQYAPYSKWFGTAFNQLPIDKEIKNSISRALAADTITDRELHLVQAQKLMADWHNSLRITEFVDVEIQNYFGRNIKVIFADRIFEAVRKELKDTAFESYPFIGAMSEVANFVTFSDHPKFRENVKAVYER